MSSDMQTSSGTQGQQDMTNSSGSLFLGSLFGSDQTADACRFVNTQRSTYCDNVNGM